ncbi:MAG: DUF2807 domain-containing protein [Prolixibacteraceae bacterium]|nr:DUF2807 domain-containing protein [Prolixibacteraceae bacterium]
MKTRIALSFIFLAFIVATTQLRAEEQTRKVDPFTEISLRIGANVHLEQGAKHSLEIVAKPSTLDEIITEVKEGKLIIRFPNKNYLWKDFQPGEITIYVSAPEINGLGVSGSGDIIAEDEIKTKILDMAVSGSGNIKLSDLNAERVKTTISGSGDIVISGSNPAQDLSVTISGSGNFKGLNYSADDVSVKIAGSGNVGIEANKNLYVRLAGSGNVTYKGKPLIDQSIAGSGSVRKAN